LIRSGRRNSHAASIHSDFRPDSGAARLARPRHFWLRFFAYCWYATALCAVALYTGADALLRRQPVPWDTTAGVFAFALLQEDPRVTGRTLALQGQSSCAAASIAIPARPESRRESMTAPFRPDFVDHVVFFVEHVERSRRFYALLLGDPAEEAESSVMFPVGSTRLFFVHGQNAQPAFDKERIGLNHLAFGVRTSEELQAVVRQLDAAKVQHSGICIDRYGNREYVWMDDPDGMRVEFYLRPE
jgi:glyoxylase I family protein